MGPDSRDLPRWKRFSGAAVRLYRALALLLMHSCSLFLLLNIAALALLWITDRFRQPDPVSRANREANALIHPKVYPHYDYQEISQIWQGCMAPLVYEPFAEFKERPRAGKWVNVSEHGFRMIEGQGPWPPDPACLNIFVFGGSTTFGYGVADHDTWPSRLQAILATRQERACVYNLAQGYYYSVQERVLFERLLLSGYVPDMAVFMDGLNDFCFADDNTSASKKLAKALEDGPGPSQTWLESSRRLPLGRAVDWIASRLRPPSIPSPEGQDYDDETTILHIIHRYWENKKIIEAVARAYGVTPIFIWQPVPTYRYDLQLNRFTSNGFMTHTRSIYGYPVMAQWVQSHSPENDFVWLADMQEGARVPLYVDLVHYSPKFHDELATQIDIQLGERGLYDEARRQAARPESR